jgi:hypothetical protein
MHQAASRVALCFIALPLALAGCATGQGPQALAAREPEVAPVPHSAPVLPAPNAQETQAGLQITHIGLTASGGLVDLRLKVLDAAKARALLGNAAAMPMLLAGDQPPLMPPHKALHGARYIQGQVVYILYPNLRGAVKAGAEVTLALGDLRLGPVTAQ